MSLRIGSSRVPSAPLCALFSIAVLAIAWVASSEVCTRPVALTMSSEMGSMAMPMTMTSPGSGVMICPVVLALIVLAAALSAWALAAASRDRHRAVTGAVLVRALSHLPVLRTFATLALAGGLAIASIVAIDGHSVLDPALCGTLAFLLAGTAVVATLAAIALARTVLAFCRRLILALAIAIGERRRAIRARRTLRAIPAPAAVFPVMYGRGLRAPPLPAH